MLDRHTTVHNATVCVNFVEKDTFMRISFVENVPKNSFLFAFFNYLFFDTKIMEGGGGAQAPSTPSPATGMSSRIKDLGVCSMISIPGSPYFANLVMMSSAPTKSVGDARYASQDPFIQSTLSHAILTPICNRSAFFLRRTQKINK